MQKCAKVCKSVQKCAKVCKSVQACSSVFKRVQACSSVFKIVFKGVQGCARVCKGVEAAGVSHNNQRAQTCTFEGPGLQKTTKIQRKHSKERVERMKIVAEVGLNKCGFTPYDILAIFGLPSSLTFHNVKNDGNLKMKETSIEKEEKQETKKQKVGQTT